MLMTVLLLPCSVFAVVNAEVTRVVIAGTDKGKADALLRLANSDKEPTLVQLWLDEGDPAVAPDKVKTSVVIIPPVFKMAPGEIKSVRMMVPVWETLAQDRETLYWLNIYQIPPQKAVHSDTTPRVILPLRIRMKVFLRPKGVAPLAEADGQKLRFQQSRTPKGRVMRVMNPTAWYMTINNIHCGNYTAETVMVAPFSDLDIPLKGKTGTCQRVSYDILNDEGNIWSYTGATI